MKDRITYSESGHATSFEGTAAVNVYAMAVLASALRLYGQHRIRVNRAYTPARMVAAACAYLWPGDAVTARRWSRPAGRYLELADLLSAKVQAEKTRIAAEGGQL